MITEIPSADDFRLRADGLLHMALSIAMQLYTGQSVKHGAPEPEEVDRTEYWDKCRPALANALTLIQQAHELYLKARIAAVSPFLLIAREPQQWPKEGTLRDIRFSEFLTLGAAELPRIHDMVCADRLDDPTRELLRRVREQRNVFVHQGEAQPSTSTDIFLLALETHRWVYPDSGWFVARDGFLANDETSALFSADHVTAVLHGEFAVLREALTPSQFKLHIGGLKKGRWYRCPHCWDNAEFDPEETAQLRPNSPTSSAVFCVVCEVGTKVERRACLDPACPSNVHVHPDDDSGWGGTCLVCGADDRFDPEERARRERYERSQGERVLEAMVATVRQSKA